MARRTSSRSPRRRMARKRSGRRESQLIFTRRSPAGECGASASSRPVGGQREVLEPEAESRATSDREPLAHERFPTGDSQRRDPEAPSHLATRMISSKVSSSSGGGRRAPLRACSRRSAGCSDRSPRCEGRRGRARSDRRVAPPTAWPAPHVPRGLRWGRTRDGDPDGSSHAATLTQRASGRGPHRQSGERRESSRSRRSMSRVSRWERRA